METKNNAYYETPENLGYACVLTGDQVAYFLRLTRKVYEDVDIDDLIEISESEYLSSDSKLWNE